MNRKTIVILCGLLAVSLTLEYVIFKVGLVSGEFLKHLIEYDYGQFVYLVLHATWLILINALVKSCQDLLVALLKRHLYFNLIRELLRAYMRVFGSYFCSLDGTISNRILTDARIVSNSIAMSAVLLITSPFVIIWYMYQSHHTIQLYGILGIIGYWSIGVACNVAIARFWVANIIMKRTGGESSLRKRIDFFEAHNRVLSSREIDGRQRFIRELTNNLYKLDLTCIVRESCLKLVISFFQIYAGIVPYIVIGICFFSNNPNNTTSTGERAKTISTIIFQTQYLIYLFARLYEVIKQLPEFYASQRRISNLRETLLLFTTTTKNSDDEAADVHPPCQQTTTLKFLSATIVEIEQLNLYTPRFEKLLVSKLSCSIRRGNYVLVSGNSGCGKTCFAQFLLKKWPWYHPQSEHKLWWQNAYYVSSRPVFFDNEKLYEQFDTNCREQVNEYMKQLGLDYLVGDQEKELAWNLILSEGEKQRLAFIKALVAKPVPDLLILDEFTLHVDTKYELIMLSLLKHINNHRNIAIVMLTNKPSLLRNHFKFDVELDLGECNNKSSNNRLQ